MFTYTEAIPSLMATILQSPEEQVSGQSQHFFAWHCFYEAALSPLFVSSTASKALQNLKDFQIDLTVRSQMCVVEIKNVRQMIE